MTRQSESILEAMAANPLMELAYEDGALYLGNHRIPKGTAVLMELIRAMAIRRVEMPGCTVEYYRLPTQEKS